MSNLLQLTEEYVCKLLNHSHEQQFHYHNSKHTKRVVKSTKELINHYPLDQDTEEQLLLAAWFHDTGYTKSIHSHEASSCSIAEEFLKKQHYEEVKIKNVTRLILATKLDHIPNNLPESIIRDADSSHLAKKSYRETSDYLKEELEFLGIERHTTQSWIQKNIDLFKNQHQYHTTYAQKNWEESKQKNLIQLCKDQRREKLFTKKETLKAQLKNDNPDRSAQTLFRVALRNHLKLSDIADTKANILLSVNAIVISLILANLIPKLDNPSNTYLIYPTLIFVVFCVASIVLSILATRPNITRGSFTKEDVKEKRVNLLFFGNFHQMKITDYEWALNELVHDKNYIYQSLTKDLYYLGVVLNKKYKILRITYNIFMIGIVVSVIAFGIAFRYFGPDRLTF